MKFGVCCGLDRARAVVDAGFDYLEMAAGDIWKCEDLSVYRGFRIETTNLFFASHINLYSEQPNYRPYAEELFGKVATLGVKLMVVGSGWVRVAPEGVNPGVAEARFCEIIAELAEMAKPWGLTLAPENLNHKETNVGNDLAQFSANLDKLGVPFTADTYHVLCEGKSWSEALTQVPAHVHISNRERNAPKADDREMIEFAAALKRLGYEGRVSIEAHWELDELAEMLANLSQLFEETH